MLSDLPNAFSRCNNGVGQWMHGRHLFRVVATGTSAPLENVDLSELVEVDVEFCIGLFSFGYQGRVGHFVDVNAINKVASFLTVWMISNNLHIVSGKEHAS